VAEQELKLQQMEEQDDLKLECELEALAFHESDLYSCEATLVAERKGLEETFPRVLLAADIRDVCVNSRVEELVDREKRLIEREKKLAETQLQELATARSRLKELQAAWVGEAQKVWDFLGQTEATLVPLSFCPLRTGDPVEEVSASLPLLDSTGAKMRTAGGRGPHPGKGSGGVCANMLLEPRSLDVP
jgi:hypothetical protein